MKYEEEREKLKEDIIKGIDLCRKCKFCLTSCPMFEGWLTQSAIGKLQSTYYLFNLNMKPDKAIRDIIFSCALCAQCETICGKISTGVNYTDLIVKARELLVEEGIVPRTQQDALTSTYKYGNPWKGPIRKRDEWTKDLKVKNFSKGENAEILYFVGCTPSYDTRAQEVARAMSFVLSKVGVDFGILGKEERCCGAPILRMGERGLFEMLVKENIERFEKYRIDRIVTVSPHCYNTFIKEYPQKGLEVQHCTQFLSELVEQGRLNFTKKLDKVVAYHDSCFLGRYNEIYDAPRKILGAIPGLTLVEMPRNREDSFCCGGGGGMMWMDEVLSKERTCIKRAREAAGVEPDIIATACPFCLINLEDGIKVINKEDRIQVKDITELVKDAM